MASNHQPTSRRRRFSSRYYNTIINQLLQIYTSQYENRSISVSSRSTQYSQYFSNSSMGRRKSAPKIEKSKKLQCPFNSTEERYLQALLVPLKKDIKIFEDKVDKQFVSVKADINQLRKTFQNETTAMKNDISRVDKQMKASLKQTNKRVSNLQVRFSEQEKKLENVCKQLEWVRDDVKHLSDVVAGLITELQKKSKSQKEIIILHRPILVGNQLGDYERQHKEFLEKQDLSMDKFFEVMKDENHDLKHFQSFCHQWDDKRRTQAASLAKFIQRNAQKQKSLEKVIKALQFLVCMRICQKCQMQPGQEFNYAIRQVALGIDGHRTAYWHSFTKKIEQQNYMRQFNMFCHKFRAKQKEDQIGNNYL